MKIRKSRTLGNFPFESDSCTTCATRFPKLTTCIFSKTYVRQLLSSNKANCPFINLQFSGSFVNKQMPA